MVQWTLCPKSHNRMMCLDTKVILNIILFALQNTFFNQFFYIFNLFLSHMYQSQKVLH